MAEEIKEEAMEKVVNGQDGEGATPPEVNYIQVIKELKQNSVSRQDYDKLVAENKQLLENYVNGTYNDANAQKPEKRKVEDIRDELFNNPHNNLDYVKLALELREAVMSKGDPDPFIPVGKQINATNDDKLAAENVAKVFQECIDYAEGDSGVFTNELQRRTHDVKILRK